MRGQRLVSSLAAVAFVGLFAVGSALGQTTATGALAGIVTDPSGAAVPNVTITVTNPATGQSRTVTSDATGVYHVPLLPPGTYSVEFVAQGFKRQIRPGVIVNVTETEMLNVSLELGTQKESVTVSGGAALVQTETTTLGHVVDQREVVNLPLVSRNYTQILALSSGVAAEVTNAATLGRNSQDVYVNGIGNAGNNFQMDGIEINNYASNLAEDAQSIFGGIAIPNPDAIQEFKVQTGLYDAASGRAVGANVTVVTKSGTNEFHGNVWEFFRNSVLNANDFFSNRAGTAKPVLRQNQFGGTFGGPIRKDKFFIFGSYQGTRQANGVASSGFSTTVLPPLTDDRSAATLGTQFCGQSGLFGGAAVACDGSNINPVALKLLNYKFPNGQYLIPTPQVIEPNGTGFSVFSIPARWTDDQFLINTDYVLFSKHTLSSRFFYSRSPETLPFASPADVPGFPDSNNLQNRNFVLKLSSALTPTFFNEARFGFVRNYASLLPEGSLTSADFGITPANPSLPGILGIYGPGFSLNFNACCFGKTVLNTFSGADQISWTHGKHSIRAGFEFEKIQYNSDYNLQKNYGIIFLSFPDFLLGESAAQNGSPYSNVYSSQAVAGYLSPQTRATNWSAYVQDDIKVNSQLTLNAGFRWEIFGQQYEKHGRLADFWPELATNDFSGGPNYTGFIVGSNVKGTLPPGVVLNSNKTCCLNSTPQNWGPRFGLAWKPLKRTDKLVVRSGYGIFHTVMPGYTDGGSAMEATVPPFAYWRVTTGTANALATFQQPYNPAPPPDSAFPIWIPRTPTSALFFDSVSRNLMAPLEEAFSLNVQGEILPNFLLEVGYVGTRGERLLRGFPANQAALASLQDPINGITTNAVENAYLRVPVMGVAPGSADFQSSGSSWYNALQASVTKRFSRGLQFGASYAYNKSLDNVPESQGINGTYGGMYDGSVYHPGAEWGPSDYERPQRFVFNYVWELPSFRKDQRFVGKALSGWQLSGVTVIQDGHRLSVTDPRSGSIVGGATWGLGGRAQLCPGMTYANIATSGSVTSRVNSYVNANAFCAPPAIGDGYYFGDLARGVFGGPDQNNWDMAITKRTRVGGLRENANLEFRAEFFNTFNHPQFADPPSGLLGGGVGIPGFNQITALAVAPRIIQFALKYNF